MRSRIRGTAALVPILFLSTTAAAAGDAKVPVVADGRTVSIEYTLKLDDGTTADSNKGGEPLVFHQGQHEILPALEAALAGMKVGESRKVTLEPAKAYGEVDPKLVQEVEVDQIPADARVVGTQLVAQDPSGKQIPVRVKEVREDKIVMDLNHPLAGKTLHFDVKVLKIE